MVLAAAYDTLAAAYTALDSAYQSAMTANAGLRTEVAVAETRIQALERVLGEARAELVRTKKPSRWGLGCAGGYGAAATGGVVRSGPALACGLTFRLK